MGSREDSRERRSDKRKLPQIYRSSAPRIFEDHLLAPSAPRLPTLDVALNLIAEILYFFR